MPLNRSVCSVWRNRPVVVNRGRVPRDWADYRKIEKFQSLEIVRNFPRKVGYITNTVIMSNKTMGNFNLYLRCRMRFQLCPGPGLHLLKV